MKDVNAQTSSAQMRVFCVGKVHTTSLLGCSEVVAGAAAARPCGGSAGCGLVLKITGCGRRDRRLRRRCAPTVWRTAHARI